jgi:hypothetical protein
MRSGLWARNDSAGLPTAGQFIAEMDVGFDAASHDSSYATDAPKRMW